MGDPVDKELERIAETGDTVCLLNYCNMADLPEELMQCSEYDGIKRIYAKGNVLTKLPENIGLLSNLVELYLNSNRISELPEGIGNVEKLHSLDVSNNSLRSLPASIGNLGSLQRLLLSNNGLHRLPKEVGNLKQLEVLEVMRNELHTLPPEISGCQNLHRLLLDRNHLQWLPVELCRLKSLEELSVSSNRLLCLPIVVSYQDTASGNIMVLYYRALSSARQCKNLKTHSQTCLYSKNLGEMCSLKTVYVDNNPFLHALPISLVAQEIGFNSCGSKNFVPHENSFIPKHCVTVTHSEGGSTTIWLPPQLQTVGDQDRKFMPRLMELSLRTVFMEKQHELSTSQLPSCLHQRLQSPVSLCPSCHTPIFTEAYPMVFEGQIRIFRLYRLTLCCSWKCVKLASLIIQLPLIYPTSSQLHMALALVMD